MTNVDLGKAGMKLGGYSPRAKPGSIADVATAMTKGYSIATNSSGEGSGFPKAAVTRGHDHVIFSSHFSSVRRT